nr:DUF721 domain-containing protein [Candidatus Dependentiae bacterium]
MKAVSKPLTRYCIFFKEKIFDLKKCCICSKYLKKEEIQSTFGEIPKSPNMTAHFKFSTCSFSQSLNCQQLSETPDIYRGSLKKMSFLTKKYITGLTGNTNISRTIILSKWNEIVGDIFNNSLVPEKLYKGTLILKSESPAVTQSFMFVKNDVIKKINSLL